MLRRLITIGTMVAVIQACGDDPGTRPNPPSGPSPALAALVRIEIAGPRTVAPGESIQLRVIGQLADGSTVDLADQASWRSQQDDIVSVDASGHATGRQSGETVVSVSAGSRSASTQVLVVPAGTFRLSVIVNESSASALDVRVEVVRGVGKGLFDTTPVSGRYDLYGVAGETEIRISGSGYQEEVRRIVVNDHTVVTVQVVPSRDRVDVSGHYTLAIEGDAGCRAALPPGLASRRYDAIVTQTGPDVKVQLGGAEFGLFGLTRNTFTGRMDGRSENIVFNLGGFSDTFYRYAYDPRPDVIENLGDSLYLYFAGGAVTSVSRTRLSGTFNGFIRQIQFTTQWYATRLFECSSTQISFVLSR